MSGEQTNPINGGLWALANFDPALQHFAELRQLIYTRYADDHVLTVAMDRALSVYIEAQANILASAMGLSTEAANRLIAQLLGGEDLDATIRACAALHEDPLLIEVATYAMHLSALTSHGYAPWRRFAAVINACTDEQIKAAVDTLAEANA